MELSKKIRKTQITTSKMIDGILYEDVSYKLLRKYYILTKNKNQVSKINIYLDALDKAYGNLMLNLNILNFIKILSKQEYLQDLHEYFSELTEGVIDNNNLIVKYIMTQKYLFNGVKFDLEMIENSVYYKEINEHISIQENKIKKLNFD